VPLINKVVVSNTSPIIYLSAIGDFNILAELFGTILIPQAVHNELAAGKDNSAEYREALAASWINVTRIRNQSARSYLLTDLDVGEAEAIILAEELGSDLILLDDRLGRKVAELKGNIVIGTPTRQSRNPI
jgi:predicted nucleic acid-binding protein